MTLKMSNFCITYEYTPFQNYETISKNNCPNITQVIYLQHNAKEITQLGKHEISQLQNC